MKEAIFTALALITAFLWGYHEGREANIKANQSALPQLLNLQTHGLPAKPGDITINADSSIWRFGPNGWEVIFQEQKREP